jgi:hypothetical protein
VCGQGGDVIRAVRGGATLSVRPPQQWAMMGVARGGTWHLRAAGRSTVICDVSENAFVRAGGQCSLVKSKKNNGPASPHHKPL